MLPGSHTPSSPPRASLVLSPHAVSFPHTQRFVFDGSRVPNPMNEDYWASPTTTSNYNSRHQHSGHIRHALTAPDSWSLARAAQEELASTSRAVSPRGTSPLRSTRARTATAFSLVAGDTRFECLRASCPDTIGPGCYYPEDGNPLLGPLPLDSALRGGMPARDPWRPHSTFCSPERPSIFKYSEGHYLGSYISPDYQGFGTVKTPVEFNHAGTRADVADYRYATRHSEADKQLPQESADTNLSIDRCGKQVELASGSNAKACIVPFQSGQARLALLPQTRLNDTRLGRQRLDTDPGGRGPGSYTPYISIGGAKRKSYRLYQPGHDAKANGTSELRTELSSAAFTSITRAHKFGPLSPARDSTLRR